MSAIHGPLDLNKKEVERNKSASAQLYGLFYVCPHLLLHLGHTRPHTVLLMASRSAGLPHTYTADVHTALRRANVAKGFRASFTKFSPIPNINLNTILIIEGIHNSKKITTTKNIIFKDSFLLSLSALGGSRSSWYLATKYSFIVMITLVSITSCR